MQLDKMSLNLRSRTPWEAIDLGVALFRQLAGPLYRATLPSLLLIILPVILLGYWWPAQAGLIIWWLKPLYDRILLLFLSQAIFGNHPSWREVLRAVPDLARHTGLLHALTLGRLSLSRTFRLPVRQLERQSGKPLKARYRVLDRNGRSQSMWMGLVLLHIEGVLLFGLWILINMLLPSHAFQSGWDTIFAPLTGESPLRQSLINLLWVSCLLLIEPIFVASGFALYLNRRSELEGWDIELAFRRLSQRLRSMVGMRQTLACLLTAGWLAFMGLQPSPAYADTTTPATPSQAKQAIDEIIARPEFGHYEQVSQWRATPAFRNWLIETFQYDPWNPKPEESKNESTPAWLAKLIAVLAESMRWLIWVVGGILLALGVVWLSRHISFEGGKPTWRKHTSPMSLFGLDITPDSLPNLPGEAAQQLLAQGKPLEALSLLYRASLSALVHDHQLILKPGDTELDCTRRSELLLGQAGHGYFKQLVRLWQQAAYGHQIPQPESIQPLCLDWARHFVKQEAAA
ncbi:hypothetical protein HNQ59_000202 [Chitinivorax tropicus]|uniref:DUF4129 domain-containing protein n=1 Tax=Chitinivorax tropicus TaxID=714531 RepID=A0A840MEX3_9PROT|nr:DUF4129 domain-containing protein [Chitinivorax tropicus]MBB5016940.1 hypothetical protein [Chitinivorax tropicus]